MLKKTFFLALIILSAFTLAACRRGEDPEPTDTPDPTDDYDGAMLYVHYFRFDGDYDRWSLWLWPHEPDSGEGSQYFFEDTDDFGVVAKVPIEAGPLAGSTTVGIIVRGINDWTKDVEIDRFVDMTQTDADGNVHVYLVEATVDIYYDIDDVDLGDRVNFAQFVDERIIEMRATKNVAAGDVTILKNGDPLTIVDFTMSNLIGTIEIGEDVDLTKTYHIVVDFGDGEPRQRMIRFDGFYDSDAFNEAFFYDGDLGAIYSEEETIFRLWAPISESVTLNLYTKGHTASQTDYDGNPGVDDPYETIAMTRIEKGVWEATVDGDLDGVYYTFTIVNDGVAHEVVDPYAFSSGVNGQRGMVVNFANTNPEGWVYGERPDTINTYTDAIIYELHVRDFTSHESWNGPDELRGKFLGLTERGTTYQGVKTGLDHILELGVTHVQFIPIFDNGIIDETRLNDPTYHGIHDGIFNWGYMPRHFNVVEGSYSTDPFDGHVRIQELKEMIRVFHENDLRIIMDVVYNHTGKSADSNFDLILPGYYFRMNEDGSFSNGSGTGNETASERAMVRKFIVDSVLFWAEEFNIDGFRFDLMKLHDVETMNAVADALHAIDPTIIIFGEPWTGGATPLPDEEAAFNDNLHRMPGIGVFNDDTRDGVKGSVFQHTGIGFVQGHNSRDPHILLGVTGGTAQPGLPLGSLPKGAWANEPTQTINYVSAHDNNTLHDKLMLSAPNADWEDIVRMHRQSNAIILTSQGVPFLHAGVEIMRTKPCIEPEGGEYTCDPDGRFDHNSYRSPDETNQIDWQWKVDNYETFLYYQMLIQLRQSKDVFRLDTALAIRDNLEIISPTPNGLVAYLLHDEDDYWKTTLVIHNNGAQARDFTLLDDVDWNLVVTTDAFGEFITVEDGGESFTSMTVLDTFSGGTTITLDPNDTFILYSTETRRQSD